MSSLSEQISLLRNKNFFKKEAYFKIISEVSKALSKQIRLIYIRK